MTTRILYWNIENFGYEKIAAVSTKRQPGSAKRRAVAAQERRQLITRHLQIFPQADIIVIVEVSTGGLPANSLIGQSGGWQGLREVLTILRNADVFNQDNWNLVPPIIVGTGGRAEGVGIFYKSTIPPNPFIGFPGGKRYFTGPNQFSGGWNGVSFDPVFPLPAPAAGDYPDTNTDPIDGIDFFSAARNLPAGPLVLHNANQPENQCAARTAFLDNAQNAVNFPNARQPCLATFSEVRNGAPDTLIRHLSIFGVHSPPKFNPARTYLQTLATVDDVAAANAANETKVICGDFNVNLLRADGTMTTAYDALINGAMAGGDYTLMLRPNAAAFQDGVTQGYFATHMKRQKSTIFWSAMGSGNKHYPGYGYVGSQSSETLYSIDNILVRAPAGGAQVSILNSVVGSPFTAYAWPFAPPAPPPGNVAFFDDMPAQPLPPIWLPTDPAAQFQAWMRATYRGWNYFGHIRSTSDHLALLADV